MFIGKRSREAWPNPLANTLCKPRTWLIAADLVNRLVLQNNLLVAILAEQQGGKTSFIKLLLESTDQKIRARATSATLLFSATHVVRQIAQSLGLPWDISLSLKDAIGLLNTQKQHFLLIIDEAHFVSQTLLQELMQEIKRHGDDNYFHLCLFADHSLSSRLKALDTDHFPNMIYSMELGTLSEQETKTWVLKHVLMPKSPADDQAIRAFYQQTKGNMAQMNRVKETFFQTKTSRFNRFIWSLQRRLRLTVAGLRDFRQHIGLMKGTFAWPLSSPLHVSASIVTVFLLSLFWQLSSLPDSTPQVAKPIHNKRPSPVMAQERVYTSSIPALTVAAVSVEAEAAPLLRLEESGEQNIDKLVVMDSVVVIPKPVPANKQEPVAQLAVVRTPVAADVLSGKKLALLSPQVKAVNTPHFTIQLLASQSKKDVQRFVVRQKLAGKVATRTLTHHGVTWYVLTMGDYSKRNQATRALKRLPAKLAMCKPWVRGLPASRHTAIG